MKLMDAGQLALLLKPVEPQLKALGVRRLLIVGSAARGELRPDSDLDFIVEFKEAATFVGYMELIEILEQVLGRRVDLTTLKALRPEIAVHVLAEARRVA